MMKKVLILILICSYSILAQQIKSWQNHTNMMQINDFDFKDGMVWTATNGGVFNYTEFDNSYQTITKSEGLASHTITSIAIDTENKIWIGTSEGYINVYDPSSNVMNTILEIYKTDKSNKRINDIQINGDTVFVSTEFGLSLINTKDLSFYDSILKFGNFPTETPVENIFINEKLYVVTRAGVAVNKEGSFNLIAPEAWDNIDLGSDIPANRIFRLTRYKNQLHAATDRGVIKEHNGVWQIFLYNNFEVVDLLVKDEALYSLLGNTVHKYEDTDEVILGLANNQFTKFSIAEDITYIGSNKGLIRFDQLDTLKLLPNSPGTNAFLSITVDYEGNLWGGTGKDVSGLGVVKFDKSTWSVANIINTPEFKTNSFHKVSSSNNAVYLSNWGRGFAKNKDGVYTNYDASNTNMTGIPSSNGFLAINEIREDSEGNAWILNYWSAAAEPLSVLTTEDEIINYQLSNPLSPQIVNFENLVVDQYDTKWISGDLSGDVPTEGLYYFNENGTLKNTSDDLWGRITESNGLRNRDVKALAIDHFGELIIGTSVGVDVIPNPSNPQSIRGDQYFAIRQQTINCVEVDPINQKWFGTEKGIFLMSSDGSSLLANYTKSNSPLPSDNINTIAIDKMSGVVYVGTDFGVTAISTLFIEPNKDFSNLYVYPNPIALTSSSDHNIIIDGLVEDSEIKILDVSGNLINEFRSIGGKTTNWNCRDFDGELISSGIYIVVAFDSEVNEIGHAKFAVLRK
jgi:ligand-binding sensor domain-containing protein